MTERSEALAQLSRILGDETLRSASLEETHEAVRTKLMLLVDGLVAEAAQSDDVFDGESGLVYVEQRLQSFGELVSPDIKGDLLTGARERIEKW